MDLKSYYRKIREIEATIPEECTVIISRATPEGGRPGAMVEAPRQVAARLVVEGAAELASPEQAAAFRKQMHELHAVEEGRRAAARIQVSVISEAEARSITDSQAHCKGTKSTKSTKQLPPQPR